MRLLLAALVLSIAGQAKADPPKVVTDVMPIAGLVAQVLGSEQTPGLLITESSSVHGGQLRPSQARMVQDADLIIWVGAPLTPWLEPNFANQQGKTPILTLLEVPGTRLLPARELTSFAGVSDDGHDRGHDHNHDHGSWVDPHAWLDPGNALLWLLAIAKALSEIDPDNTDVYVANAKEAAEKIEAFVPDLTADFGAPRFLVFHDSYAYFETAFGLNASGAFTLTDDQDPSAGHLRTVQGIVAEQAPDCLVIEPRRSAKLANAVLEGTSTRIVLADPLGLDLPQGVGHYEALLRQIALAFTECGKSS